VGNARVPPPASHIAATNRIRIATARHHIQRIVASTTRKHPNRSCLRTAYSPQALHAGGEDGTAFPAGIVR